MRDDSFLNELNELDQQGLKRSLFHSQRPSFVNLSSNDYLGLSIDPTIREKVASHLKDQAMGGTSSRLLAGTQECHEQLETRLASFLEKEAALVFSSGYHANTGLLPALARQGDMIFLDRLSHASLLDGVRLSSARFSTFDHNNVDHLESLLRKRRANYDRAFIVTEGVFSMDGDHPILPEIIYLAKKYECLVYLDEAHSFGLFGPQGRGYAAQLDLLKDVDIFVGTLSKTIGSQGGFVTTRRVVRDLIVSRARSFIYTTALSPLCAVASLAAIELLPALDEKRKTVLKAATVFREQLTALGFDTLASQSQIIPVWTGDVPSTKKLSDYLLEAGFFVPSIRPPTVPEGEGRVRLSITLDSVKGGIEKIINAFRTYSKRPRRLGDKIGQTA